MKKYSKYKSSDNEFVGEMPSHWQDEYLKWLLADRLMYGANEAAEEDNANHPRYIRITDFDDNGSLRDDTFRSLPLEIANDYLLKEGDILFARSGATVGKTFQFKNYSGKACFAGYLIKANPNQNKILSDYLYLYTKSYAYENWKNSIYDQATIQNIGADKYQYLSIPLPPLTEQKTITNFLNEKTKKIDALIEQKQRLIELLKEQRTALINQAVTKGLNPKAKMKDSGVEWLGEIPAHWENKKLKHLVVKVGSGITPTGGANIYQDKGVPLYRSQNIHSDRLDLSDIVFISEEIDETMRNSRIQPNDVLLNITGASIGRCYYVEEDFKRGNVNQHVCIIRPIQTKIATKFMHLVLISSYGQYLIDHSQNGANREGLNFHQIKSFVVPLPDIEEQKIIIKYVEEKINRINHYVSIKMNEIELLNEYRNTLISETVTGKIDVRGYNSSKEPTMLRAAEPRAVCGQR